MILHSLFRFCYAAAFCATTFACILPGVSLPMARADEKPTEETGTLVLQDDFNRDESTPDKEDIGNGWTSNSA